MNEDRKDNAIAHAAKLGSQATTVPGAIRFRLAHLPGPMPGLVSIGTKAFRSAHHSTPSDWPGSHERRADMRARSIAERLYTKLKPFAALGDAVAGESSDIAVLNRNRLWGTQAKVADVACRIEPFPVGRPACVAAPRASPRRVRARCLLSVPLNLAIAISVAHLNPIAIYWLTYAT